MERKLSLADFTRPRPWNQMEMKDWGFRAWGKGELGRGRAEHGEGEGVGEEEKESSLNEVGVQNGWIRFNRSDRLPRPVRPVRPSWLEQIWFGDLSHKFELKTMINLITDD